MGTFQKIAIADDHEVVRDVIKDIVDGYYSIIYEGSSAESLLRFLHANPPVRHPDMVILDRAMDGMSGIEAIEKVKAINPTIKVMMLTSFDDDEKVFDAIQNGADGYCIKSDIETRLITCLQDIEAGGSYMSPGIARKAMRFLQNHYQPVQATEESPLSHRETEILRMVIQGDTANDIAEQLHVSPTTIKTHIYNVYKKLQVTNRMEAANLVRRKGWV
ncbi:MAG: response regulator transcription factor [Chitinophagaceae bacterium]|nr:response regulator transcription factor [Chitinophagaceae bacterium]